MSLILISNYMLSSKYCLNIQDYQAHRQCIKDQLEIQKRNERIQALQQSATRQVQTTSSNTFKFFFETYASYFHILIHYLYVKHYTARKKEQRAKQKAEKKKAKSQSKRKKSKKNKGQGTYFDSEISKTIDLYSVCVLKKQFGCVYVVGRQVWLMNFTISEQGVVSAAGISHA